MENKIRFPRSFAVIFVMLAAGMLTAGGCSGPSIQADAIGPLVDRVADRHDAYVVKDQELSAAEQETYLESSSLLRAVVAQASGEEIQEPSSPPAPIEIESPPDG